MTGPHPRQPDPRQPDPRQPEAPQPDRRPAGGPLLQPWNDPALTVEQRVAAALDAGMRLGERLATVEPGTSEQAAWAAGWEAGWAASEHDQAQAWRHLAEVQRRHAHDPSHAELTRRRGDQPAAAAADAAAGRPEPSTPDRHARAERTPAEPATGPAAGPAGGHAGGRVERQVQACGAAVDRARAAVARVEQTHRTAERAGVDQARARELARWHAADAARDPVPDRSALREAGHG